MKEGLSRLSWKMITYFGNARKYSNHNKESLRRLLIASDKMARSDGESDTCSTCTRDSRDIDLVSTSSSTTSGGDCQSIETHEDELNFETVLPGAQHMYRRELDRLPADSPSVRRRIVSLDCEMVGVGVKKQSALARCSIVDYQGKTLFDHYIKPKQKITDYRTKYSGIKPCHMKNALSFNTARRRIKTLLKNKLLIGHALEMDMKVLGIHIHSKVLRDTSKFPSLRILSGLPLNSTPSLRNLSRILLGRTIQTKSHCSIEDATAALDLYKFVEEEWEQGLDAGLNSRKYLDDKFWPPWIGV